jgi:negative regulator of flagellin synthesis FlgM
MQISLDEVSRLLRTQPMSQQRSSRVSGSYRSELTGEQTPASKVEVSDQAQEVRRVTKLVNQMPETREDRVQALKAQIESGTYQVSGEQIADLIIRRAFADGAR